MRRVASLRSLSLIFALTTGFALAADKTLPAPGLDVGAKAPAFALKAADGAEVSLGGLLEKGPVALVFYRSVDWCPFCITQMKELQGRLTDFSAAGLQVVGISYDAHETLVRAAAKHGLTMTLLSDAGSTAIDAYGIRNEALTGRAAGVPHPTVFVVDQEGVIREKLQREGHRARPEADEIIAAARNLK